MAAPTEMGRQRGILLILHDIYILPPGLILPPGPPEMLFPVTRQEPHIHQQHFQQTFIKHPLYTRLQLHLWTALGFSHSCSLSSCCNRMPWAVPAFLLPEAAPFPSPFCASWVCYCLVPSAAIFVRALLVPWPLSIFQPPTISPALSPLSAKRENLGRGRAVGRGDTLSLWGWRFAEQLS